MNKKGREQKKRYGKRQRQRLRLSEQLFGQYCLTLLAFLTAFLLSYFMAWRICLLFTWHEDDPLYILLKTIEYTVPYWGLLVILIGGGIITYFYMRKPLRYLEEVVQAAEQLSAPSEELIQLAPSLGAVQDQFNLIREQALRNAMVAREAEQRKNDLIVYLAHDLKTPLTSVIGYLTLLEDEQQISPELRARYTGIARTKAERLEELINEFFDITRFNLTQMTLERERVNLTRMLEQITYEFRPALEEKQLSWKLDLAPQVSVLCDAQKLERVFDNLFRNAINYSYPNTEIELSLFRDEEGGRQQTVVRVENHGKTIPPEKLARIFEQFFRLDASRSASTGGAGLGLAIAREIVTLHGGSLCAESEEESIVFTVRLPEACQEIV